MRPYNVEIFDRNFNFIFHAILDDADFTYKYDAISPVKNTIPITKDFNPSKLSTSKNAPKGWYIRILDDNGENQGVITGFEYGEILNTIEYSSLLSLFDAEIIVRKSQVVPPPGMPEDPVETILDGLMCSNFVNFQDPAQNIPGLSISSISEISETYGGIAIDFDDNNNAIVRFSDLLTEMMATYSIVVTIGLNFQVKTVNISIGSRLGSPKTIEADLPNVFASNITIRKADDEINRIDVYDTSYFRIYREYLYEDGTHSATPPVNRILPVNNQIEFADNIRSLARDAVNAELDALDDVFSDLLEVNRNLTTSEITQLEAGLRRVFFAIGYTKLAKVKLIGWDGEIDEIYIEEETSPGTWEYVGYYDPDEGLHFHYNGFSVVQSPTQVNNPLIKAYLATTSDGVIEGDREEDPSFVPTDYPHSHILLNGYNLQTTVRWGSDPVREKTNNVNGIHGALGYADLSGWIAAYKLTSVYDDEVDAKAAGIWATESKALVNKLFAANKYSNLIELTVKGDDSLIQPQNMFIGKEYNIIHNGVTYNSILTGKEIGGGLVKLIFGTIRLDLTKILNMKGVR